MAVLDHPQTPWRIPCVCVNVTSSFCQSTLVIALKDVVKGMELVGEHPFTLSSAASTFLQKYSSPLCFITQKTQYWALLTARGLIFDCSLPVIWVSYGYTDSFVLSVVVPQQIIWIWPFKALYGQTYKHWLYFTAWPEVSLFCCRISGLADLQPQSIVLREFTVSDYMASALGRLEKYRGNATLHGFYTVLISASRALKYQRQIYDALCKFFRCRKTKTSALIVWNSTVIM